MTNLEKARYIIEQLNLKGAGLGNASWAIVSKALDDLEAAQQDKQPKTKKCTCNAYQLENFGCKCGANT